MTTHDENNLDPDDLGREISSRIQNAIAEAYSKLEHNGEFEKALKKLSPKDEAKARAVANAFIQWRKNRTTN